MAFYQLPASADQVLDCNLISHTQSINTYMLLWTGHNTCNLATMSQILGVFEI